ncbi:MAG: thioredoxin [Bacteroidetes bacterium]|nr:MAG: thioredoxin [Bacteroidota bacterium]
MNKLKIITVSLIFLSIWFNIYSQEIKPKITFLEIGSVTCIPCKKMQPILKSIEEKYGNQIKIIFYDVKKSENQKYVQKYRISLIPTQVFLDENNNEIHRHVGFYPEQNIEEFLQSKGLKPIKKKDADD